MELPGWLRKKWGHPSSGDIQAPVRWAPDRNLVLEEALGDQIEVGVRVLGEVWGERTLKLSVNLEIL